MTTTRDNKEKSTAADSTVQGRIAPARGATMKEGERGEPKPIAAFLPVWRDEITGHVLTLDELRKALTE